MSTAQAASLPDETANWILNQLEAEHGEAKRVGEDAKRQISAGVQKIDQKLDRLTAAYLDDRAFSAAEFRNRKQDALSAKRKLLDKLAAFDTKDAQRFEPVKRFVNGSKQLKYVGEELNPKEMRAKLEAVGSNVTIRNRCLDWQHRGAWQLVVDQGSFAQRTTAPSCDGAAVVGETHQTSTKWRRGESGPAH